MPVSRKQSRSVERAPGRRGAGSDRDGDELPGPQDEASDHGQVTGGQVRAQPGPGRALVPPGLATGGPVTSPARKPQRERARWPAAKPGVPGQANGRARAGSQGPSGKRQCPEWPGSRPGRRTHHQPGAGQRRSIYFMRASGT